MQGDACKRQTRTCKEMHASVRLAQRVFWTRGSSMSGTCSRVRCRRLNLSREWRASAHGDGAAEARLAACLSSRRNSRGAQCCCDQSMTSGCSFDFLSRRPDLTGMRIVFLFARCSANLSTA
eukprot:354557-Chlamydomonas_euryale.AAC.1